MKNSNENINPQALRTARERRNWTQQRLADEVRAVAKGCTKDTVSRWERGKSLRVRRYLREGLCKVLRVEWEELTKQPNQSDSIADKVRVTIGKDVQNSLQLIAKRYDIRVQDVINLAPLLFLIVAEKSLLAREHRLKEIHAAFEEANEKIHENQGHLNEVIFARSVEVDEQLEDEEVSIGNRDVLGTTMTYAYWHDHSEGPFVSFVRDLVKDLPEDAVNYVWSDFGDMIDSYSIADDTLQESIGISRDDEQGEKILTYIQIGAIDYSKCLRVRRDEDESSYRKWLLAELERIEEESRVDLTKFLPKEDRS